MELRGLGAYFAIHSWCVYEVGQGGPAVALEGFTVGHDRQLHRAEQVTPRLALDQGGAVLRGL